MFNLNIPPSSLLGIDSSGLCSTPKTPEIVNSLIAMTNPMDNYNFTPGIGMHNGRNYNAALNAQSISQDSSHSSCSASPIDSPAGTNATPSVQQTCSQLIKAGLKLSIQSKRKLSTCESSSGSEQPNSKYSRRDDEDCEDSTDDDGESKSNTKGLTPEDEDRRRRRRERNKIAATKCRMKKREKTQNLIKESEQLDTQNVDLKNQVRVLESERRKLFEMLQAHSTTCVRRGGFNLPSKLLQSPAIKYIIELELDGNNGAVVCNSNGVNASGSTIGSHSQMLQGSSQQATTPQRTAIPPVSTIKFSRNGFKTSLNTSAVGVLDNGAISHQLHQLPAQTTPQQQQLPNGYCKPSPTPQELGYLNSPSQENICLPSTNHTTQTPTAHQPTSSAISQQLSDYIPNCDNSLGITLANTSTSTPANDDNSSTLLGGMVSPLTVITTVPTTATEFVKNELVDSQSPYTTAQSAERFLFENNCESFVDIKHAVSVHPSIHHNGNNSSHNNSGLCHINNNNNNNNNNLLDFHSSLMVGTGGIGPFHDQISIKNDYLHDADLLAQLTGDAGEFVDLDTGVAAAFMASNSSCLA